MCKGCEISFHLNILEGIDNIRIKEITASEMNDSPSVSTSV